MRGCALSSFSDDFLDFALDGKATSRSFGENHLAVDEHVELSGSAGLYLCFKAKACLKRIGQTVRAATIASRYAIKNQYRHS